MKLKLTKGKQGEKISGNKTKTTGQIQNDVIPAKDKSPDDLEILE